MTVLTVEDYLALRERLATDGYAHEYEWCQGVQRPSSAPDLFSEYGWVVVNSGMRNQVALVIWRRITEALRDGRAVRSAFGHPGKAAALQLAWDQQDERFAAFRALGDCDPSVLVEWCQTLPWIGPITKWHLAKNLGVDCVKPDRHLVRLAAAGSETVDGLCGRVAATTGDRVATVDLVLWRAANLGWI
jgi:hypothetical protein